VKLIRARARDLVDARAARAPELGVVIGGLRRDFSDRLGIGDLKPLPGDRDVIVFSPVNNVVKTRKSL